MALVLVIAYGFDAFLLLTNYVRAAKLRILTTPRKHFDASL